MISYKLKCDQSHEFEGWFSSSSDFDGQRQNGLLSCPLCGSSAIAKSLMAPAVSTARQRETARDKKRLEAGNSSVATPAPSTTGMVAGPLMGQFPPQMLEQLRQFRQKVMEVAENVGDNFADEARKIHYGESEKRGIYGKASLQDAHELAQEGIELMPLPELPEDRN